MNIYVGNLSGEATETDLRELFEKFGQVESVNIVRDRFSGESRGFGFVEMPTKEEAEAAIKEASGQDLKGKTITVDEAKPKPAGQRGGAKRGGFGGGGRRGGPGGGGGGGGARRGGFGGGSGGGPKRGGRRY